MEQLAYLFENIFVAWPSILMGALVPGLVLLALSLSKVRKQTYFFPVLQGFATFFMVLIVVAILAVVAAQTMLPSISVNSDTGTDIVKIGGTLILILFYLGSEAVKQWSFASCSKRETQNRFVGLTFGSGFILAQNLLVLGLIYNISDFSYNESLAFGFLMVISGIIYILISEIGYQLVLENYRYVGAALAASYFLIPIVMLLFTNMIFTYVTVALALVFNLIMGFVLLPLPFKKKEGGEQ